LGGGVTSSGLATYSQCGSQSGIHCTSTSRREPHYPTLTALEVGWASLGATYASQIPDGKRDVSNFASLQLRVAVDFSDSRNATGHSQDFSVQLVDGAGRTSTVRVSDYVDVLYYPPGSVFTRAAVMNTARIPMMAFANVDRTSIASVNLIFDQYASGGTLFSDIAFADEGMSVAEIVLVCAAS
jgi:hypothetical protein